MSHPATDALPAAIAHFVEALLCADVEGMTEVLAADAILHSPIVEGLRFEGREQLAELFAVTTAVYEQPACIRAFGDTSGWALVLGARIGSQRFEETLVLTLDERGRIFELTASIRPLSGAAAVAAAVGGGLAHRRSRARSLALAALTAPLVRMTRSGDRLAPKVLGAGSRTGT